MRSLYAGQGRAAAAERVLTEGRRIDPRDMCEPPPIFVAPSVARISPRRLSSPRLKAAQSRCRLVGKLDRNPRPIVVRQYRDEPASLTMDQNKAARGGPVESKIENPSQQREVPCDRDRADQSGTEQPESITESEVETVEERSRLPAPLIYEIVRRMGEEEMARPVTSLWWSGVAAGLSISFRCSRKRSSRPICRPLHGGRWSPASATRLDF
jgi:hypothetical protein